ncbi:transcriptional regulator [Brevundimonas sp. AJA228-03]|uniref:transcriptional regulator n=1 Tax=Brevundimonas sp. AJA228-03 TaxID=2752515 RepID=UPI001ADFFE78|nr:transcriptional regulator [Brevundimonas sp. AJA228-03]QTN20884.1 transcriptional regulator [Brevundimonas sp. AJA228-03]
MSDLLAHHTRAGVLAYLSDRGSADFTEIARALETANNVLSRHLERLSESQFIRIERGFLGRKPRTRIVLTPAGRQAWAAYLDRLT